MGEDGIDSENNGRLAPDTAKPKGLTARPKPVIKKVTFK